MKIQRIISAVLTILILIVLIGCPTPITDPTDAELVAAAKAALDIGYGGSDNANSVTQDLTLPTTGTEGTTIKWSSDNTAVITDAGEVTRPASSAGNAAVKLTATISKGGESDTKEFSLTVLKEETTGPTDADLVAAAKAALAITYESGDSNIGVTQDLTLPTTVTAAPGVTITWSSDNTAVITDAGAVTRPASSAGNAAVKLTATIEKGDETDTKEFSLTVLAEGAAGPTDAQLVAAAKAALVITDITFASGEDKDSVTQDVTLPDAGDGGTTIAWSSDNAAIAVAGTTGTVARPSASSSDATVTLTATISKESASDTKTFDLTVLKEEPTDIGTLGNFSIDVDDTTAKTNTESSHSVTVNGDLSSGSDYTLSITDPLSITDAGVITIPDSYTSIGAHTITVTAAGIGNYSGTKEATFTLTVGYSDAELVATAKTDLAITYGGSDNAGSVTQDVTLPTTVTSAPGVSITWSSDNTAINAATGTVTRPSVSSSSNASVTLTATITKGAATATKTFDLTVLKEEPTDIGTLTSFTIDVDDTTAKTNTESSHSVTVNGGLSPGNDYTLSITDPLSITNAGAISIPNTYASSDTYTITVTAAGIGNYSGTKEKTFTLTVVLSDADAVAAAKTALVITDITFASGEDKDSVTQDVTLPTSGDEGTTIAWSSDNAAIAVAGTTGTVARPSASSSDATVTLTATISKGSASDTKTFVLTVLNEEPIDIGTLTSFTIDVDDTTAKTNTESSHSVTVNGGLTEGSDYTLSITDPLTITNAGAITIPDSYTSIGAHTITVTAAGIGNYTGTKEATFTLTVVLSDADAVAAAKAALVITDITFASGEDKDSVTQDVTLPTSGDEGTAIAWSSDNTAIDTAGAVTRPSASSSDATVTLTATITKGTATDTKTFTLTVLKEEPTDIGTLGSFTIDVDDATVEAGIADTHSVTAVNGGLTAETDYTLSITPPLTITNAGAITIPANAYSAAGTPTITVTAAGTGNYSGTKTGTFVLTVNAPGTAAVAAAKAALDITDIGFASGEDKDNVKQNITLPTSGEEGTTISWSSDNTAVITAAGAVTRPSASSSDASVTLTATISKESATDTKTFTLTVLKEEPTDIGTLGSFTIDVDDATVEAGIADTHSVTAVNGGLTAETDYTLSITPPLTITNAGAITIPANAYTAAGTPTITVTAAGTGNYSGTKTGTFVLTVNAPGTAAVAAAKAALTTASIGFATGEDKDSVTQDITLPTTGTEGTAIAWSSDNTAIDTAGTVTRPDISSSDATVTLTATISKGSASDTKTFVLTVLKEEPTDIGTLGSFTIDVDDATVEAGIADTHSVTAVNGGLTAETDYTLSITPPLTITNAGAITIPANAYTAAGTPTITVTAAGTGNYSGTKTGTFVLTVNAPGTAAVAAATAALTTADITFAAGEDASKVIQDITLPAAGTDGTSITWSSNNGAIAVAGTDGTVTRPANGASNAAVTLTATITKDAATDTKTFTLTVIEMQRADMFSYVDAADGAVTINNALSANSVEVTKGTYSNIKSEWADFLDPKLEQASLAESAAMQGGISIEGGGDWNIDNDTIGEGTLLSYTFSRPVIVRSLLIAPRRSLDFPVRLERISIVLYDNEGDVLVRFDNPSDVSASKIPVKPDGTTWTVIGDKTTDNYGGHHQHVLSNPMEGVYGLKLLINTDDPDNLLYTQFNYFNAELEF